MAYLSFFTRFPIPWWLFLLSLLLGFANTEVVLAVSNYLIRINKGELYNGVIIGYALMNVFNALLSMLINLTGGYGSCGRANCSGARSSTCPCGRWSAASPPP